MLAFRYPVVFTLPGLFGILSPASHLYQMFRIYESQKFFPAQQSNQLAVYLGKRRFAHCWFDPNGYIHRLFQMTLRSSKYLANPPFGLVSNHCVSDRPPGDNHQTGVGSTMTSAMQNTIRPRYSMLPHNGMDVFFPTQSFTGAKSLVQRSIVYFYA